MYHHHRVHRDISQLGGVPCWLAFRCLPAIVIAALALLLLSASPTRAESIEEGGAAELNGLESGHMLLRDEVTGSYTPAILQSSKVHFDISGMLATAAVEQSFRNDTDRWVEAVYAFPLPENAAVRFMEMVVGERRIVGKIREKNAAKKIYQVA